MSAVSFEKLGFVHADIVAALHEAGFDEQWTAKGFQDLISLSASFGYLAVLNDQPVGFILCQGDSVEAEIITITTHPDYQRSGVASQLLQKAISHTSSLFLEVATDNPGAISFYEKHGFSQIGLRKGYYKRAENNNVDALVLKR